MGAPSIHESNEEEDSVLDSLTREQLDQAAEDYDENKQVRNDQSATLNKADATTEN
jgi:hypothetical protein